MAIPYQPTDWTARCEALCRKTGKQCPHRCSTQIPNSIAHTAHVGPGSYSVQGRHVRLCRSHSWSWIKRQKRLLSIPLIEGGHLTAWNTFGVGSKVIAQDRYEFDNPDFTPKVPKAWGVIGTSGEVPQVFLNLPTYEHPALKRQREFYFKQVRRERDKQKKFINIRSTDPKSIGAAAQQLGMPCPSRYLHDERYAEGWRSAHGSEQRNKRALAA